MATIKLKRKPIAELIADQQAWIDKCGGSLSGYIRHYGSIDQPDHYGNGGEAIYAADKAELDRLKGLVR